MELFILSMVFKKLIVMNISYSSFQVKKEVKYYNNYLKDPRRPQLPENPQNKAASSGSSSSLSRHSSQRDLGGGHSGGRSGYVGLD